MVLRTKKPEGQLGLGVPDAFRLIQRVRRGQHEDVALVLRHGAVEEDLVDVACVDQRRDRLGRAQVQVRGHVAALQVEVEERHLAGDLRAQPDGQVDRQGRAAEPAAAAVDGDDLADQRGTELSPAEIHAAFEREYLEQPAAPVVLREFRTVERGAQVSCAADLVVHGEAVSFTGKGNGPIDAFMRGLAASGRVPACDVQSYSEHSLGSGAEAGFTAGCTISRPRKPPRSSPRTRTRVPAASAFCCDG